MLVPVLASLAGHVLLAVLVLPMPLDSGGLQRQGHLAPGDETRSIVIVSTSTSQTQAVRPAGTASPPPVAQPPTTVAESAETLTARRYFDVTEVDTPAMPLSDWEIDAESLLARGVSKLSFEILISEDGEGERCRILTLESFSSIASDSLAARLCSTRLSPALKAGIAVPSVRRIELFFSR